MYQTWIYQKPSQAKAFSFLCHPTRTTQEGMQLL